MTEDEIEVGVGNETTIVQLCTAIRILLIIGFILYFSKFVKMVQCRPRGSTTEPRQNRYHSTINNS